MASDQPERNAKGRAVPAHTSRDRVLVIMAKAPRAGYVKTRLVRAYPAEAVIELYRSMLHDTVRLGRTLPGTSIMLMCPQGDREALGDWSSDGVEIAEQQGPGLIGGLRSALALCQAGRRVLALDSDSPHIPGDWLIAAFDLLDTHDLVVGPTEDGGYYSIGGRAPHPSLFDARQMSTGSALEALLVRARELGLSVGFTERSYDVDRPEDLERLAGELRRDPDKAPRTAALLRASTTFASACDP